MHVDVEGKQKQSLKANEFEFLHIALHRFDAAVTRV
jgi:hypothetical protein